MNGAQTLSRNDVGNDRDASVADVGDLRCGDAAGWDAFVRALPNGTFFYNAGWRRGIGSQLGNRGHYLGAGTCGDIVTVLPLVHVKSWLFRNALMSLPFLVYRVPLADTAEARDAIVARAMEIAPELRVEQLDSRYLKPVDVAEGWGHNETHLTFCKSIDLDPDIILGAIARKQRAMIRKDIRAGLTCEMDHDVSRLYSAMLECKRNAGTAFLGRRILQAIKDTFGEAVEILTVAVRTPEYG